MKNRLLVWLVAVAYSVYECEASVRRVQATEQLIAPIYLSLGLSLIHI